MMPKKTSVTPPAFSKRTESRSGAGRAILAAAMMAEPALHPKSALKAGFAGFALAGRGKARGSNQRGVLANETQKVLFIACISFIVLFACALLDFCVFSLR